MRTANYPNHPLFRIAPILDKGFQTVRHDEYTSRLVGRIRAGRYMTELWDCNSLYLGYSERLGSPIYQQQTAFKSRYQMTPDEIRAYRDDPARKEEQAQLAAERKARAAEREAEKKAKREAEETKLAAQRRVMAEERGRFAQEYAAVRARRKADQEERDRIWSDEGQRTREARSILSGRWECTTCLRPSKIFTQGAHYILSCPTCGRSASADHATLLGVITRQAQLQPANSG